MLWIIEILMEQDMIYASNLSKLKLVLELAIKQTSNMKNRVNALAILNRLLREYALECHLEQILSEDTLRRLMRLLSESLGNPAQSALFDQCLKAVTNVLAIDSVAYLQMALNADVIERLHSVILTERVDDVRESVWALSNIAG